MKYYRCDFGFYQKMISLDLPPKVFFMPLFLGKSWDGMGGQS